MDTGRRRHFFRAAERLHRRREYNRVFRHGRRFADGRFRFLVLENPSGRSRLGLVISRKVGKAAVRNRVKRLLREAFRNRKQDLPVAVDVVVIPQPRLAAKTLTFEGVLESFGRLIEQESRKARTKASG